MIRQVIKEIIRRCADVPADLDFSLEFPPTLALGDYATNLPLLLAKQQGKKPMEVAAGLATMTDPMISKIEVAPPGFLNIKISAELYEDELKKILSERETYGDERGTKGKIQVEFISANPTWAVDACQRTRRIFGRCFVENPRASRIRG